MSARQIERLSGFATISRHERTLAIDQDLIQSKSREAAANPRKREVLILHRGNDDPLQRMLNALQPGSYIRPHRHRLPPTAEPLVLLSGAAAFIVFDDHGSPDWEHCVLLHRTQGALAMDHRENIWHTFFALQPDTVLFEVKSGPFDPGTPKEFAAWAPEESSPEASGYLESLEGAFYERFPHATST